MKEHTMRLQSEPFEKIKSGGKTIELRLYDEKRRQIAVGDIICFANTVDGEQLRTCVTALHRFDSFAQLYDALPLSACGYAAGEAASPKDMERYYSQQEQSRYGVLGIEIELL